VLRSDDVDPMPSAIVGKVLRPWSFDASTRMLVSMWIDQRGSEILTRAECLRLLAVAGHAGAVGRVAAGTGSAPLVHPVNFSYDGGQVLVRLGDGTMAEHLRGQLVAFEVDALDVGDEGQDGTGHGWSVLVRGLATAVRDDMIGPAPAHQLPRPLVPVAGAQLYAIRPDVVSGRRFPLRAGDVGPVARH
jgi:hypothetical protein